MRILSVFGTRPEAIKMAPVVNMLANSPGIEARVCITGQHRDMVRSILDLFNIRPDWHLDVMQPNQSLNGLVARVISAIDPVLADFAPDRVLVHGDTSSALAAGMAAFHHRILVGHVEAGLRTGDIRQPWPEEMNRRSIDGFADLLLAPTERSRQNLLGEGLGSRNIVVTGNTVIDALLETRAALAASPSALSRFFERFPFCHPSSKRLLLVTGHRRENFGAGFLAICEALAVLARRPDIQIVYPVHLNPNVREPVMRLLASLPNVELIEPLEYADFVLMMGHAHVILTDSGGVQEEAPALGRPVLVMRDVTERPEALEAGTVKLVGTDRDVIIKSVAALYDDADEYARFSRAINPYGDGHASERILGAIRGEPVEEFVSDVT